MRTVYEIRDVRTNAPIISCLYLSNASKIWERLTAKHGDYFTIKKVKK